MLIQAKRFEASPEEVATGDPLEVGEVEASGRAAQILAEMMGIVCHEVYWKWGDQMVPSKSPSLH